MVTAVIALLALWLAHTIHETRAQATRNARYQTELMRFKRDLRLGMSRSDVQNYLRAQKIAYDEIDWNYDVKVGEDPSDNLFCENWDVFIDMHFVRPSSQLSATPTDHLDGISVRRIGTCL